MRIGVVGYGNVGKALADVMLLKGHQVYVNDVKDIPPEDAERKNFFVETKNCMAYRCDVIFVCVPTPYSSTYHSLDTTEVHRVLAQLIGYMKYVDYGKYPVIAIKSTVPIGATEGFSKLFNYSLAFVPEFLRQKSAYEDCLHPFRIIVGSENSRVKQVLGKLFHDFDAPIYYVEPRVAEMAKLFSNAFLSTKVAFSQQIAKACDVFNVKAFPIELLTSDPRIGYSHLDPDLGKIPGTSVCLPKDLACLIKQIDSRFFVDVFREAIE